MEGIEHRHVEVNGIKMHVAEKGEGPVVLFIHGFPELWYSWRHQMVATADRGYKAVAPDLRGYGDTDAPTEISSYTCFHIVGDLIALIDHLGADKVTESTQIQFLLLFNLIIAFIHFLLRCLLWGMTGVL